MGTSHIVLLSAVVAVCVGQRSPYAGRRPIGFPVIETTTSANAQNGTLGNKFGEAQNATTQRLPIEALGDSELVNRLGQLPQDKQPFWFINWQAIEQNRNRPQSYPLRPNIFADNLFFSDNNARTQEPGQNVVSTQQPLQNTQPINNQQLVQNGQVPVQNGQVPIQNPQSVPGVLQN